MLAKQRENHYQRANGKNSKILSLYVSSELDADRTEFIQKTNDIVEINFHCIASQDYHKNKVNLINVLLSVYKENK